jgi:hypothetical protein
LKATGFYVFLHCVVIGSKTMTVNRNYTDSELEEFAQEMSNGARELLIAVVYCLHQSQQRTVN